MKRIFNFILALVAFAMSAVAQSSGSLTAGVNLLSSDPTLVRGIQFFDTSGANNTVTLYDNDSASSTNRVRAAFTTTTQFTTNVVMSFTNFTGVVQTYTNAVLARVNSTVAASTNEARRVFRIVVPANGTVNVSPIEPYGTTYGAQILATGTAIYNADIGPLP
jgi:hypothetical protein